MRLLGRRDVPPKKITMAALCCLYRGGGEGAARVAALKNLALIWEAKH